MAPLLNVKDVSKRYQSQGGANLALQNMTFSVQDGEFVSLVGPSGCGKTTLLKICAGIVEASTGSVDFSGSGRAVEPGRYGIVFQRPALLPWRTVLENIVLPAAVLRHDLRAARKRAADLLDAVGLPDLGDRNPGELSGGMQQRVAIARALVHDPLILFMDEPFGALDAFTRETMGHHLEELHLQYKKTVVFVTHSITEAVLLSDRIIVLSGSPGRLMEDITVSLPRPRPPNIETSAEFRELEAHVRDSIMAGAESASPPPREGARRSLDPSLKSESSVMRPTKQLSEALDGGETWR